MGRNQATSEQKRAAILFLLIGIIFTVIGLYLMTSAISTRDYQSVEATITDTHRRHHNHKTTYYRTVEYTVDGKHYTGEYSTSSNYAITNTVTIWYDPDHPERMRKETFVQAMLEASLFMIISLVAFGAGVYACIYPERIIVGNRR